MSDSHLIKSENGLDAIPALRRFILILSFIALTLIAGFLAKLLVERVYAGWEKSELARHAQSLLDQSEMVAQMAQIALLKANSSPFPKCSRDDLAFQRKILFETPYIKDIGRLDSDRLVCSPLLGQIPSPHRRAPAHIENPDGTFIYGFGDLSTPHAKGIVIGRADANIVVTAAVFDRFPIIDYHFSVYLERKDSKQNASLYHFDGVESKKHIDHVPSGTDRTARLIRCKSVWSGTDLCVSVQRVGGGGSWYQQAGDGLAALVASLCAVTFYLIIQIWKYRHQNLSARLKKAISSKQLTLAYQPIVRLSDNQTIAFEALLRWEISNGAFVPPDVFVAKAEQTGLITRLTKYVIDQVLAEMGDFLVEHRSFRININVTAADLEAGDFLHYLAKKLAKANIFPTQIGIEITERSPISSKVVEDAIQCLSNKGHPIYIDDFGTGYSSLAYLGRLRIDAVKIDRSFTHATSKESAIPSILPQILSIAKQFQLSAVVEGIEHAEQASYLQNLDRLIYGQGWHYGKPHNAAFAIALLKKDLPHAACHGRSMSGLQPLR